MNNCSLQTWNQISLIPLLLAFLGCARATADDRILWTAKWNHEGSQFAIGGIHSLWIFDAKTFEKKSLLPTLTWGVSDADDIPYFAVTHVAWHPGGNRLAVSSQGRNVNGIYDVVTGERIALTAPADDFGRGISWNPDGSRVAFTSDDRLLITKANGTLLHDIPRYKDAKGLTGVAWSPKGDRMVTIGGRITLHDARGRPIKQKMHRPEAEEEDQLLLGVAWHPSGEFFTVSDYGTEVDDPVLQFWSADADLMKSITLKGDAEVRNVAWNREGSRLASASMKLQIWNQEGELEFAAEAPDLLWGVDWHPNGNQILTSSIDGRVTMWSSTAQVVKEIVVPVEAEIRPK